MKIKAFYVSIYLLLADLITSLPQVSVTLDGIRVGGFSFIGTLRFAAIPLIIFVLLDSIGKTKKKTVSILLGLGLPIVALVSLFLAQTLFIPADALSTHLSGCTRHVFWGLVYLCLLITLQEEPARKVRNLLLFTLLAIFLATIVQYPFILAQSGTSLSGVLTSYGQVGKVKTFALFRAANEDGNAIMTLFSFALLYAERTSGFKKIILRYALLICIPIALLFNGTRTALIVSFPLITLLFYSNLSIARLLLLVPIVIIGVLINYFAGDLLSTVFSDESTGDGTLDWRIENLWAPTTTYTYENSPIFGFGTRGWEYVCHTLEIVDPVTHIALPAHNVYVWVYASWGLLGVLIFLSFLVILIRESLQLAWSKNSDIAIPGKAVFCAVLGYCLWGSISNAQQDVGWLILYCLAALVASLKVTALFKRTTKAKLINTAYSIQTST